MRLKIAIVVHGRFHAFDLANALLKRGHDVTILTNYPKWAVKRFGIPRERVQAFWPHGVAAKLAFRLSGLNIINDPSCWLLPAFSRWAASRLSRERWDVIHMWSGASKEILGSALDPSTLKLLMRGSAHIREQRRLLQEEQSRATGSIDMPDEWIIEREEREYALVDVIVTLSSFSHRSFLENGIPPHRLARIPLGVATNQFRPSDEHIRQRCHRIQSGEPLRVLYTGLLSFRKGIWDFAEVVRRLPVGRFRFQFVGTILKEMRGVVSELSGLAEFVPRLPQSSLPERYADNDLFVFPTIEDGFAAVLAQAHAAGLPILTTPNCGGPDLISEGETGWVLPIRNPKAFIDRLLWCDSHRAELAAMVRHSYDSFQPRDWNDVAADFEAMCQHQIARMQALAHASHGR